MSSAASPGFSTDFKELVRSRTNLVELVGETLALTPLRGGADYVGLCPFHDDHNPSFHVYPDRQSYRCWVCQEGGDCFSFLMKTAGVGFPEALEQLARRARIELPKEHRKKSRDSAGKNQLLEALAWAETEFHQCLLKAPEAQAARDYLHGRGFSDETIAKFRLGYHPEGWTWLFDRARGKFRPEQLLAARLIGEGKQTGKYYDHFRSRVVFPIRNERSHVVAFGGRVLPGDNNPDAAKYWNSPESELFSKSRLLYGLDVAREAIRRSQTVIVVEGYVDCIMLQQHGLANVVGTLGTALTETHVTGLKRFARKVVLLYDGDDAGRMAAERSLVKFLSHEVDLRVLTLPGGLDPDEFIAEQGADALRAMVDQSEEAWEYKLKLTIDRHGLDTIDARHRVLDEMLGLMSQVPRLSQSIRRDIILGKLAQRLRLDEKIVRQQLGELVRTHQSRAAGRPTFPPSPTEKASPSGFSIPNANGAAARRVDGQQKPGAIPSSVTVFFQGPGGRPTRDDLLECELLQALFLAPHHITGIQHEIAVDDFRNSHLKKLLQLCYDLAEQGLAPSYECVLSTLEDPELKRLAARLDEMAREMQIAEKLHALKPLRSSEQSLDDNPGRAGAQPGSAETRPPFLDQVVRNLKGRRQEQTHERLKGQTAAWHGTVSGLDQTDKELLRLLSKFHQQRAVNRP